MTTTITADRQLLQELDPDQREQRLRLLEQQGRRIALLQADIEEKQLELDALKSDILEHWPAGDYETGTVTVRVSAGAKRLDETKFEAAFPAGSYPQLYKAKPDMKAVKQQFAPLALDPYLKTGKGTVKVS